MRYLDESEFAKVVENFESLTNEIIDHLRQGRHDAATKIANQGMNENGKAFGGLSLIFGPILASIELVARMLTFYGPLEGISDELAGNPSLKRGDRLDIAMRVAAAIIAQAGGIQGASIVALEQGQDDLGEDFGVVTENVWISFCKLAAYGEYGEDISSYIDFVAEAQNAAGIAAACMLLHQEGHYDLLTQMLVSCVSNVLIPEELALVLKVAAHDRDLSVKEVRELYESVCNELEELDDVDDVDEQGAEEYSELLDYLIQAVDRASSCTSAKDLREKIDRIFNQIA